MNTFIHSDMGIFQDFVGEDTYKVVPPDDRDDMGVFEDYGEDDPNYGFDGSDFEELEF